MARELAADQPPDGDHRVGAARVARLDAADHLLLQPRQRRVAVQLELVRVIDETRARQACRVGRRRQANQVVRVDKIGLIAATWGAKTSLKSRYLTNGVKLRINRAEIRRLTRRSNGMRPPNEIRSPGRQSSR